MLAAIYTYGEPIIAEIAPLTEVSKINPSVFKPQYWGNMPNSNIEKQYTPIWVTGNGELHVKSSEKDAYYTPATVHGDWKLRLHQKIVYATRIYTPPTFRPNGTYMSKQERQELFGICVEVVDESKTFKEAVEKLRKRLGIATCVKCGNDFYVSPNYKGNKPMCQKCRLKDR